MCPYRRSAPAEWPPQPSERVLPYSDRPDRIQVAIPVKTHDGRDDGGITNSALGIKDSINFAPIAADDQVEKIATGLVRRGDLERQVIGIRARDAGRLRIEDGVPRQNAQNNRRPRELALVNAICRARFVRGSVIISRPRLKCRVVPLTNRNHQ